MPKKTTEPVTGQIATVEAPVSANLTLAQLGQRMSKGRKASSGAKTATAKATAGKSAATATSSEQAEAGEATTDLSQTETEDSAALAGEATGAESPDDAGADADAGGEELATPTTDESEGARATEDEENAEGETLPRSVRDLQKRVNRLTAKNASLQEDLKERDEQIARLQTGKAQEPPPPHAADRSMGADRMVQEIDRDLGGIEAFLVWADENPEGGSYMDGDKSYSLTGDEIRAYRRKSEAERVRLNTRREARLQVMRDEFDGQRAKAHAQAVKLYPWVEQKASPEFQDAVAIIRANPGVLELPDFELVVARQVSGQRLEREALKRIAKNGGKPNGRAPTPVVTFSPSSARKVETKDATVSAAEKRFRDGGGRESDLSKLLAQRRLARLEAAKG